MTSRNPLRTPEGAWYHAYYGYKPQDRNAPIKRNDGYLFKPGYTGGTYKDYNDQSPVNTLRVSDGEKHPLHLTGDAENIEPLNMDGRREYRGEPLNSQRDRELDYFNVRKRGGLTDYERSGGLGPRRPLYDPSEHLQYQADQLQEERNYKISPRRATWADQDGRYSGQGYSDEGEGRMRESPSPRRGGPQGYDPSFHDPPSSPRRPPMSPRKVGYWERADNGARVNEGHVRVKDPRAGPAVHERVQWREPLPRNGPRAVFTFIRFPLSRGENIHKVQQWCLLAKPHNMGGHFVGISHKVFDFGMGKDSDEGCAVFQFPSLQNAEIFINSDKQLKQQDFPRPQGNSDIFSVELEVDPAMLRYYDTFLYSEIHLNSGLSGDSMENYERWFKADFTRLLEQPETGACPYAAFSTSSDTDRKMHRKHFFGTNTIVTLHMFRTMQEFEALTRDERYCKLRAIHNAMATEKCSVFSVERIACP